MRQPGQNRTKLPDKRQPARGFRDRTDYEHRHFVNLVATAFILALALIIGWTIKAFDSQQALERCLDSGRIDCRQVIDHPVRSYVKLRG